MITITRYIIGISLALLTFLSCDTSKSLQSYIVEKQEDNRFLKVDLATSLLSEIDSLPQQQRQILESIKKINVVAYPKNKGTQEDYDTEMARLSLIFDQEKYQVLGRFKTKEPKSVTHVSRLRKRHRRSHCLYLRQSNRTGCF